MKTLPPLPDHVTLPSDGEIDIARRVIDMPMLSWRRSACPLCDGTRTFSTWESSPGGAVIQCACPCEDQMVLERWMAVRGIDRRYRRARLTDATHMPAAGIQWLIDWIEHVEKRARHGHGYVLRGAPGSGKTLGATLALKRALLVPSLSASRFLNIGTSYRLDNFRYDEYQTYWATKIKAAPVLVIDNLGSNSGTKRQIGELESLILDRAANALTTIITTTLSQEALAARYNDSVAAAVESTCDEVRMSLEAPFDLRTVSSAEEALGIMRPTVFLGI